MQSYYCHNCAAEMGLIRRPHNDKLIRSSYQAEKYLKHTVINPKEKLQSLFSDPSTAVYADYIVDGIYSGSVEVDDHKRPNIILPVGSRVGFRYEYGNLIKPQDAVKVVLYHNDDKIHAFPENSTSFKSCACERCGQPVIY
jgi:hypothetical protein